MSTAHYDVAVIGGGPGGYTAALYGARAGLSVLVLEKMAAGGQMTLTSQIDNYPGIAHITGLQLVEDMLDTMYEIPSDESITNCMITKEVVEGTGKPVTTSNEVRFRA